MSRMQDQGYLARVRQLSCVICAALGQAQQGDTYAHHIRETQGMAQRAHDYLAIPLCYECHQGDRGIHGDRSRWRMAKLTEADALALTIEAMAGQAPAEPPRAPKRTLDQNAKMWAALTDISRQVTWPVNGRAQKLIPEDWKQILSASLVQEQRVAQGVQGGWVMLGVSTSRLPKRVFCDLITVIDAFGAQQGVHWSDPEWRSLVSDSEGWLSRAMEKEERKRA